MRTFVLLCAVSQSYGIINNLDPFLTASRHIRPLEENHQPKAEYDDLLNGRTELSAAAVDATTVIKYYYFNGMRIATRKGGTFYYLHSDHLGSTVLATQTTNGATIDARSYYGFGKKFGGGTSLPTDNQFTGQKLDTTGLMYYNARYYDPSIGQFISPDTIVPDPGLVADYNRYMMVRGNPLKYTDPTGHCATTKSGSRDLRNDSDCWTLIDSILNSWDDTDFWSDRWPDREIFEKHVAIVPGFDFEFWFDMFVIEYGEYKNAWDRANGGGSYEMQYVEQFCAIPGNGATCITQGLDAIGTTSAAVAIVCAASIVGNAGCSQTAAGVSVTASGLGVVWTAHLAAEQEATDVDLAMAATTFTIGAARSSHPFIGLAASIAQWVWDSNSEPSEGPGIQR